MKKLFFVIDDIFLFVGCLLAIVGGALISPVVAVYTAAVECFVLSILFGRLKIRKGGGK